MTPMKGSGSSTRALVLIFHSLLNLLGHHRRQEKWPDDNPQTSNTEDDGFGQRLGRHGADEDNDMRRTLLLNHGNGEDQ